MIINAKVCYFLFGYLSLTFTTLDDIQLVSYQYFWYQMVCLLVHFMVPLLYIFKTVFIPDIKHQNDSLCFLVIRRCDRSVGLCTGYLWLKVYLCPKFIFWSFSRVDLLKSTWSLCPWLAECCFAICPLQNTGKMFYRLGHHPPKWLNSIIEILYFCIWALTFFGLLFVSINHNLIDKP